MNYKKEERQRLYREAVTAFPEAGLWGVKVALLWRPLDYADRHDSCLLAVSYEFNIHGHRLRVHCRGNDRLVDRVKQRLLERLYPKPSKALTTSHR